MAHVFVAILLLLLALCILATSTYGFVLGLIHPPDPDPGFATRALVYLSDLLFGVIVLELLSTILTYIQARNLEATIKDFLVVALISSIRKILLVGAHSSIDMSGSATEFKTEATGTVFSIVGILLLIGGLILLDMRMKAKQVSTLSEPEHPVR